MATAIQTVTDAAGTKPEPPQLAYTIREAARALRISRGGIYRLIQEGRLKPVKIFSRLRIPAGELNRLLEGGRTMSPNNLAPDLGYEARAAQSAALTLSANGSPRRAQMAQSGRATAGVIDANLVTGNRIF